MKLAKFEHNGEYWNVIFQLFNRIAHEHKNKYPFDFWITYGKNINRAQVDLIDPKNGQLARFDNNQIYLAIANYGFNTYTIESTAKLINDFFDTYVVSSYIGFKLSDIVATTESGSYLIVKLEGVTLP